MASWGRTLFTSVPCRKIRPLSLLNYLNFSGIVANVLYAMYRYQFVSSFVGASALRRLNPIIQEAYDENKDKYKTRTMYMSVKAKSETL